MSCNDGVFTATSSCRFFDFTLTFSNSILAIFPASLAIIIFVGRAYLLYRKSNIITSTRSPRSLWTTLTPHSDPLNLASAFASSGHAALHAGLLIALGLPSSRNLQNASQARTMYPAVVLSLVAALLAVPLVSMERKKTRGGSMFLPLWLFFGLLFDACRIRTFTAIPAVRHTAFFYLYVVAFAFKALMLATENGRGIEMAGRSSTHEARASFFSRLFFLWVIPLLRKGYKAPLQMHELDDLKPEFMGSSLSNKFLDAWCGQQQTNTENDLHSDAKPSAFASSRDSFAMDKLSRSAASVNLFYDTASFPKKNNHRSLLYATFKAFPMAVFAPVPWRLLLTATELAQPFLVSTTLAFVQSYSSNANDVSRQQPLAYGWGLVGAYAFVYLGQALATGQYWYSCSQLMTKIRGSYVEAIYRKGLSLHIKAARTSGGGKAANLMSVDSERIVKGVDVVHSLWSGVVIIAVGCYLLYQQIGIVFLASLVSVVVCFVLTPLASKGLGTKQGAWSAATDKRVDLTSSIVSDIKGVKFSAYEDVLYDKVCKSRDAELKLRATMNKQLTGVITFTNVTTDMLSLATFVTLIVVDRLSGSERFNLNTVITTLTIFSVMQSPLLQLGQEYSYILSAWASVQRVESFLNSENRPDLDQALSKPAEAEWTSVNYAARFENASLGWSEDVILKNVTLEIPRGQLTMICGRLGEGKSTLLQAILGESDLIDGQQHLPILSEQIAYVSQDVWLQDKRSIRENVIFATGDFEEERYTEAIKACALDEDIETLQEGDATEAGALSGGQRQRLAVARAVYSRAEVYLLDDVTSALDAETSAHMWRALMGSSGLLRGKTIVMATNAVHLLHHASLVVRIEDGKIAEQGRYEELSMKGKVAISRTSLDSQQPVPVGDANDNKAIKSGAAGKQETVMNGAVGWKVYAMYVAAAGLGNMTTFAVSGLLSHGGEMGLYYYLQAWAVEHQRHPFRNFGGWLSGYTILIPINGLFLAIGFWVLNVYGVTRAGRILHAAELRGILSAPISLFKKWTAGQITNRFSQDLFNVDSVFPQALINTYFVSIGVVGALITMVIPAPYLAALAVVLIAASVAMQRVYIPSSRQLRRLEMAAKSPLYTLFSETSSPSGLATVRGLKRQATLVELNTQSLDESQKPYYHLFAVRRWLQTWLLLFTTVTNVVLVLLVVVLRHSSQAGLFGVALVQATSLGIMLNHTVISMTEVEIAGVALERVREFSLIEPEEAVPSGKNDDTCPRGDVVFDRVTVSYGPDLDPAVKDLSFHLPASKRLGIVGRSGSGKSTTLLALFRMIEMRSGNILIDGQPIASMSAKQLRSRMTVVPQNPLVMSATVRENLDPEGVCTDAEIWSAVQKCKLTDFVKKLDNQLEEMLVSGKTFISSGQKQLLSLARALLRKRKILVLDEATSAMDVETDAAVQDVLQTQFSDCTIIAVAHRIATIINFDQIICMSAGRCIESGTPQQLLEARTEFWALAREQRCI